MEPAEQRFVITGCSSGGKSTLLEALAMRGAAIAQEPGREVVKEQLAARGDGLPWENAERFAELCISKATAAHEAATGLTFFDRSALDNICALAHMGRLGARHRRLIKDYRYARIVFFAPPWPEIFEKDAERKHGFEAACAEAQRLALFYPKHGYELVFLPKASVSQRVDFVLSQVARNGPDKGKTPLPG